MLEKIPKWTSSPHRIVVQLLDFPQLTEDSYGLAIAVSLYSILNDIPVSQQMAFIGKVSINGDILPITNTNQRLLALLDSEISHLVIPEGNLEELKNNHAIKNGSISVYGIQTFNEILEKDYLTIL